MRRFLFQVILTPFMAIGVVLQMLILTVITMYNIPDYLGRGYDSLQGATNEENTI